jgi:hypothetical protein
MGDLAVVSCYFNPCGYRSRERNLRAFLDGMRPSGIPLFLAELVFPGQRLHRDLPVTTIPFAANDVMWHKERLLNLVAAQLPAHYSKVAWVDADILFASDDWYHLASEMLDTLPLVQLFHHAHQADSAGTTIATKESIVAYAASGRSHPFNFETAQTWPGLAWAAHRDLISAHGLFDRMILGGADTYMSLACYPETDQFDGLDGWHADLLPPKLRQHWQDWARRFAADVSGKVGYVPSDVVQLGHGTTANRQYVSRWNVLNRYDFDPAADIGADGNGVWAWSSSKRRLHTKVRKYFAARREDDA